MNRIDDTRLEALAKDAQDTVRRGALLSEPEKIVLDLYETRRKLARWKEAEFEITRTMMHAIRSGVSLNDVFLEIGGLLDAVHKP